jgi:hypothetical protein
MGMKTNNPPEINFIREIKPGAVRNFFGESHQRKKDWVYRYTVHFTPNTSVQSQKTYSTIANALSAGNRMVQNYCK